MKDYEMLNKEFEALIAGRAWQKLFDFMEENMAFLCNTPEIPKRYQALRSVDLSVAASSMPRLIMAWLAFLSGDHARLFMIIQGIEEATLHRVEERSLFYSLRAMIGTMTASKEGMCHAKQSIDVLPQEDSIYLANAKLTYGQLLAGTGQHRHAAEVFASAYAIFYKLQLSFLAAVALVNELLNRYKLGEMTQVIDKCKQVLQMNSSYTDQADNYWDILHLPLGMCCYELNKPSLAIEHLETAKAILDKFAMFHMHGLVELYLFRSYYLLNDKAGMEQVKTQAAANFGHMHYKKMDQLLLMLKIFTLENADSLEAKADIEKVEMEFSDGGVNTNGYIIDALVFLKQRAMGDTIKIEDLKKKLELYKRDGVMPQIQVGLLQLAELYCLKGKQKDAATSLREAIRIYREYGIAAPFYMICSKSIPLIEELDKNLFTALIKGIKRDGIPAGSSILSAREKEIVQMIAKGKTNDEISRQLYISVGTTKWHINNIFGKLEVKNRVQAIEKAKALGEL